jgi:hypothetical protein
MFMRTHTSAKPKASKRSLTDSILTLCASGRFGVREAIAAATHNQPQQQPEVRSDQALEKGQTS